MAMLGGGAGGAGMYSPYAMGMYDPAALAATQRLQFGQGLMQQGLDAGPAYPAQALSRLGQSLIGALMMKRGFSDLAEQGKNNQYNGQAVDSAIWGPGGNPALAAPPSAAPAAVAPVPPPSSGSLPVIPRAQGPTAGMQANNPGNLMDAGQPGESGVVELPGGRKLAAFPDMATGVAANARQLAMNADNHGVQTVRQMVNRWVGDPKADLTSYIADAAKAVGADPDAPVNWHDPKVQAAFLQAQYPHESAGGSTSLQPADVQAGVALANKPQGVQYAQAANIATDATPAPVGGAQQPQAATGQATPAAPQTGLQSQRVQTLMGAMNRAQQILAAHPFPMDPVHLQAQAALEQAKEQLTVGAWRTQPNGVMVNDVTGEQKAPPAPLSHYIEDPQHPGTYIDTTGVNGPKFAPAGRFGTNAQGDTLVSDTSGVHVVSSNPSGITGNTPDANAMRTLAAIGPKIANGTATPQEQANYSVAAEVYQGSQIHPGPAGELLRIPVRPLPPGMPQPGAPQAPQIQVPQGSGGAPQLGGAATQAPGVTTLTGPSTGPKAAQAITESAGQADEKNASERQALVMKNHDILGTTSTIRSLLPQVTQGVGADQRLKASQVLATLGVPDATIKQWMGTDPNAGEVLQKKLFELTTGAVRGMGAREPGSVMMMFQKNYPQMSSRNMTTDAMSRLLDMDQVYQEDEVAGQRSYLGDQVSKVAQGKQYEGLSGYQQPDPRLYQAAALATGGMPYSVWSQGLTPEQQTQALKLGSRVYPDASALDAKGVRHVFQAPQNGR
jgi:hypothetical protein